MLFQRHYYCFRYIIFHSNPKVRNHQDYLDTFASINRLPITNISNNLEFPRVCRCYLAEYITNLQNEAAQNIVYSGILNSAVSYTGSSKQRSNG